jgi:hypothetical protein
MTQKQFSELDDSELRRLAAATDGGRANWSTWTRDMLLAFFLNRYRDGLVPEEIQA